MLPSRPRSPSNERRILTPKLDEKPGDPHRPCIGQYRTLRAASAARPCEYHRRRNFQRRPIRSAALTPGLVAHERTAATSRRVWHPAHDRSMARSAEPGAVQEPRQKCLRDRLNLGLSCRSPATCRTAALVRSRRSTFARPAPWNVRSWAVSRQAAFGAENAKADMGLRRLTRAIRYRVPARYWADHGSLVSGPQSWKAAVEDSTCRLSIEGPSLSCQHNGGFAISILE